MWKQQMFFMSVKAREAMKKVLSEERGASGTIELVVIIGIVLVIAFLFRNSIGDLFESLFNDLIVDTVNNNGGSMSQVTVD